MAPAVWDLDICFPTFANIWPQHWEGRDQLLLDCRGDAVSEELPKNSPQFLTTHSTYKHPFPPAPTHSQLGKPGGLLGRLLVGSVCQGGDDALAMAEQVHL